MRYLGIPDHPRVPEPSPTVARFGRNVRSLRELAGWSQEELAHRAGITSVQISRVERGAAEVRLSTVVRLTHAFGGDANALLVGVPRP